MEQKITMYEAICGVCKQLQPHIIHSISRKRGIRLISLCHNSIFKRYHKMNTLKEFNFEEIEKQAQTIEKEVMKNE